LVFEEVFDKHNKKSIERLLTYDSYAAELQSESHDYEKRSSSRQCSAGGRGRDVFRSIDICDSEKKDLFWLYLVD